jgi:hypothetical protein
MSSPAMFTDRSVLSSDHLKHQTSEGPSIIDLNFTKKMQ